MSASDPRTNAPPATRLVRIGGVPKFDLLSQLANAGVQLNEAAEALFADDRFTPSPDNLIVETVETSVAGLGFDDGATFAAIVERAAGKGLSLCPLELGPHLRLLVKDQAEGFPGKPSARHRAPPGSITIASTPFAEDDGAPQGFYLRRIEGVLWLRGYYSCPGHVWSPQDVFVFMRDSATPSEASCQPR